MESSQTPPFEPDEPLPGDRRRAPRPDASDRRRRNWQEFRAAYPGILAALGIAFLVMVAVDFWLIYRYVDYRREIDRLRSGMTSVERNRTDMLLESRENRFRVMLELIRRQARLDAQLHLSVAVDSGVMYLEREGAVLREMDVRIGPERTVGIPPDTVRMATPLGERTVERVLGPEDAWEIPQWVYRDRGLPTPEDRTLRGALGPTSILLTGGTVIYSAPTVGPLNDPEYVMPGSVRVSREDMQAIAPNLKPGTKVYFY